MITKNVTVYLGDGYPVRIPVSQYDTMWRFVFKVVYNDEEWTIPSGATAVLNGRKPDGNVFAFSGTIANNRVTVDSDTQLTPVYGEVYCELSISHSSTVVGTANFVIDVEQAPKTNDAVISDSALDAYGEILEDISTVTGHMVPSGGSSGQVLTKASGDDYDTTWATPSGGGGDVSDVTVAGTSVVSSGTAVIPKAGSSTWGVVKHETVQGTTTTPPYDKITSDGLVTYVPPLDSHTLHIPALTLPDATTTEKGAMTATDKNKLDGLHGLPSGGTSGYVLKKASGTDYDVTWAAESGGGGGGVSDVTLDGVSVVTGGVAVLTTPSASDIGAYVKPSGGIPATDIASGVIPSVPSAYTSSPSALGTASAGSSTAWAKGDHVHPMPSAADVGAAPAVSEVTISTAGSVTQALSPNTVYHFTGALTSLTITLTAAGSGELAHYHFDFISGSTAITPNMTGVTMPDGFTFEANKRYEVDVLNGWGVAMSWTSS